MAQPMLRVAAVGLISVLDREQFCRTSEAKLLFTSEFWTKFHREVSLCSRYENLHLTQCEIVGSCHAKNQLDSFSCFDSTPICDRHGQTQTQTDTGP